MARVAWGSPGEKRFETGVDRGVLYLKNLPGVAWNGLTAVSEKSKSGEVEEFYLDGNKYRLFSKYDEYAATIEAFSTPSEFDTCLGRVSVSPGLLITNQKRYPFGFSYRTLLGNDLAGVDNGYKIHLVYNAVATPPSRSYSSLSNSPNPNRVSLEIDSKAPRLAGHRPTAHVVIDSTQTPPLVLSYLENILYGDDVRDPRLPYPEELVETFASPFEFLLTVNGDGSYTVEGLAVERPVGGGFIMTHPDVIDNGDGTFDIL